MKLKYFTAENAVISYMYLVCFVICVLRLISLLIHMISLRLMETGYGQYENIWYMSVLLSGQENPDYGRRDPPH
jgi:hypothetical protein